MANTTTTVPGSRWSVVRVLVTILTTAVVLAVGGGTALILPFGLAMGTDGCFSPEQGGLCDASLQWILWIPAIGAPAAALVSAVGLWASRPYAPLYGLVGIVVPVVMFTILLPVGAPDR